MAKYIKERDTDTGIERWDENRKKLNKLIGQYNEWLIDPERTSLEAKKILNRLEFIKQTVEDYEELEEIKTYVLEILEE